jgi:hypothetical protein
MGCVTFRSPCIRPTDIIVIIIACHRHLAVGKHFSEGIEFITTIFIVITMMLKSRLLGVYEKYTKVIMRCAVFILLCMYRPVLRRQVLSLKLSSLTSGREYILQGVI